MITGSSPHTRRGFCAGLAGAALAPLAAGTRMYAPQLAARTTVWLPLGAESDSVFAGIAKAGYTRVVLDSAFTGPAIPPLLRKHGLQPAVAAIPAPLDGLAEAARPWGDAGLRMVEVAAVPGMDPRRVTQAGHGLDRLGMRLLLRTTPAALAGGGVVWHTLVRETEAPVVSLAIDVAVAPDPLALIDAASPRLACVTLQSRQDGAPLEEIGNGQPDMARLAAFLRRISYDGYLAVDLPAIPSRTQTLPMALAHSRWYVHQVFGMRPGAPPVDMGPHVRTRRS
jgi:hypothetical protein